MHKRYCFAISRLLGSLAAVLTCVSATADTSGTGFFISNDGLLVTNYHVIVGASELFVRTVNGDQRMARAVIVDRSNDLAILQVDRTTKQTFLPVRNSSMVKRGTQVITVGFPMLSIQGTEPKVTGGIVSSLSGLDDDPTMMQISVPVQPGNSGGPLIAMDGAVVGIVTSKLNASKVQKITGDIPQNVNFAVKSAYLLELFTTRPLVGRVKPVLKGGQQLSIEELVRRTEDAVAIVVGVPTTPVAPATLQPKPDSAPRTTPSPEVVDRRGDLVFANVRFDMEAGYLIVRRVEHASALAKTTLRFGDRVVECANYQAQKIYGVSDIEKCSTDFVVAQEVIGKQYVVKVLRNGDSVVASIVVRSSP